MAESYSQVAPLLHALCHSDDPKNQYVLLLQLKQKILCVESDDDLLDKVLTETDIDPTLQDSTFSQPAQDSIFTSQEDLNTFTCFLFEKQFGWSEGNEIGHQIEKLSNTADEMKVKTLKSKVLAQFIKWTLNWKTKSTLDALRYTISHATNKPVVRNQTVVLMMDWLKTNAEVLLPSNFDLIKDVIIEGLIDVWSAIRNACVSRLSPVVEHFTMHELEAFHRDLIEICRSGSNNWQAKEGAVMGLNCIVRRFQWVGLSASTADDTSMNAQSPVLLSASPHTDYFIQFGKLELRCMPEFITSHMYDVIFPLLSHPQLSVREHATKTFSSYLSRCEFQEALTAFKMIIEELGQGTGAVDKPHLAVLKPDFEFMDAYAAEGLLGVCIFLVKHIAPGFLLPDWPRYASTFNLFLMHPASTVRQATSEIFKFLVTKGNNDPVMLKLVLQELCGEWKVDHTLLSQTCLPAAPAPREAEASFSQQRRRSLKLSPRDVSGGLMQRYTVTTVGKMDPADQQLSEAWEWREGRLLAYELILKFLIKNHWLYTFGSHNPSLPADVSLTSSTSALESQKSRTPPVKPAASYSGTALKQTQQSTAAGSRHTTFPVTCHSSAKRTMTQATFSPSTLKTTDSKLRMPSLDCTSPPKQTLVHHYSYYSKPSAPFRPPGAPSASKFASLLSLAHDVNDTKVGTAGYSVRSGHLAEDNEEETNSDHMLSQQNISERNVEENIRNTQLPSLSSLLQTLLYQTIECLADVRWEIRRIGQQVLPCLVEVIRWYDMKILVQFLNKYLLPSPSLLCYGACIALKNSIAHAAKLQSMLSNPPSSWQDPASCKNSAEKITLIISGYLSSWTSTVQKLIQRPSYDKLSVAAMETIIQAHNHFNLEETQKISQSGSVIDFMKRLFCYAHPEVKVTCDLIGCPSGPFQTAADAYLCCSTKTDSRGAALQVEKYLYSELHGILPSFLKVTEVTITAPLLPVLVTQLSVFIEDDDIVPSLINSLEILGDRCCEYLSGENSNKIAVSSCQAALTEIATLIREKTIDKNLLHQILVVYLKISKPIPVSSHFPIICQAITAKLNNLMDSSADPSVVDQNLPLISSRGGVPRLSLDFSQSESEDDTEKDTDPNLEESQTLNTSNNSGSGMRNRHHSNSNRGTLQASQQSDEEESDWDSWSEDEVDQTAISEVFTNFLLRLKEQTDANKGNGAEFQKEVKRLSHTVQTIVETLVNGKY